MKTRRYKYDVAVVGAGSAGVSAAFGVAQAGYTAALIDRSPCLGGQATNCNIPSYCGFYTQDGSMSRIVGGVVNPFLEKLAKIGADYTPVISPAGNVLLPIDPESAKYALDECLAETPAGIYLETLVARCQMDGSRIQAIECFDDEGAFIIEAKAFVDASGEANLAHMAGADMLTFENVNLQIATLVMRIGGVADEIQVTKSDIEDAIAKGIASGMGPFTKETGYIRRMPISNDFVVVLASQQLRDLTSQHITEAGMFTRKQCWAYLEAFKKFIPGCENAFLVSTGPKLGIRESRHILGEYVLSRDDVLMARRFEDTIGRGSWPIEIHASINEPSRYTQIHNKSYYDIPIRTLKSVNIDNLWGAGRIVSCDRNAFGSVRVMGTAFVTGHAAGVAAALSQGAGQYHYQAIQHELRRQGAIV